MAFGVLTLVKSFYILFKNIFVFNLLMFLFFRRGHTVAIDHREQDFNTFFNLLELLRYKFDYVEALQTHLFISNILNMVACQ